MTFNPSTLVALGSYWTAQGGRNLGVVGDTGHVAKGVSYHLGADQLAAGAYSRQTARDKAGLSNAASAIDLGRLDGSLVALRDFSKWLVARARMNATGTSDMREVIYSPDGKVVMRWDRERGYASAPKPGEADDTHLTHTHISWYRDAEKRDHTTAFRPYFDAAGGDEMPAFKAFAKAKYVSVPSGGWLYDNEACAPSAGNVQVSPGRDMPVAGKLPTGVLIIGYVDTTPTETELPTFYAKGLTPKDVVAPVQPPPVDTTPFSQADLDAARAAGQTAGAAAEKERIAEAEADRVRGL